MVDVAKPGSVRPLTNAPHCSELGPVRPGAPDIAYVARDWTAKLGLAVAGLGITIVPGLAVPILPPNLAVVRIDHPAATRTTAMVIRSGLQVDPGRQALQEALLDAAAEIAGEVRQRLRSDGPRR